MTHVMFHLLVILSAFSSVYCSGIVISVIPSMDEGPIIWKQTVTVSCTWTPGARMYGDVVVGEGESIWSDPIYGETVNKESPDERIYFSSDDDVGIASLVIKDVTVADERKFGCSVSRKGSSSTVTLDILEPPAAGVPALTAVPHFTTVDLSWPAVEGATSYKVSWRAKDSADWNEVDVTTTSHTADGLSVASEYEAKVDASNAAGIREGILPAETTFTTKDNRPPHPVDDLAVQADAGYNQTSISISWALTANTAENRIVAGIDVSAVKEGAGEEDPVIAPQTLAGDATSATFELGGPGTFVFTVKTFNDYSGEVDTARSASHLVKETTDPPTVKPTTTPEPTTKKPTTEKPTTKEPTVKPTVAVPNNVLCGDMTSFEPMVGAEIQLACTVPDDAKYEAGDITWSYKAGDQTIAQDEILNLDGISIVAREANATAETAGTSTLRVASVAENNAGTYTCVESKHSTSCAFEVTLARDVESGAVFTSLSTALSLVLLLALF